MDNIQANRPARAEIDLAAIVNNIAEIRKQVGEERIIMAVMKANAYGHGVVAVAHTAVAAGVERFAMANIEEAMFLRGAGITQPILILGFTPADQINLALANNITLTVFNYEMAQIINDAAARQNKTATVHIKIDTGMSRLGFAPNQESVETIKRIFALPHLYIEGIFSHFALSDSFDQTMSQRQLQLFTGIIDSCEKEGLHFPIRHMANSGAICNIPESYFDMVRPGIILYGWYPSDECHQVLKLKPAMSIKVKISQVRHISVGDPVSYGCKWRAKRPSIIATLPIGYADGLPRLISDTGCLLVHGKRAPIAGRICMDQLMIDVTDIPDVQSGDVAVLIGRQGEEFISAEEFASWAQTINYEILVRMSSRLPLIYKK